MKRRICLGFVAALLVSNQAQAGNTMKISKKQWTTPFYKVLPTQKGDYLASEKNLFQDHSRRGRYFRIDGVTECPSGSYVSKNEVRFYSANATSYYYNKKYKGTSKRVNKHTLKFIHSFSIAATSGKSGKIAAALRKDGAHICQAMNKGAKQEKSYTKSESLRFRVLGECRSVSNNAFVKSDNKQFLVKIKYICKSLD